MSDAPATLLTPEATTDELADQIMEKMEASANPETEPEKTSNPEIPVEGKQSEQTPEPEVTQQTLQDQPKYKVKVRGEEQEVTLDELRNGYSRTEDYKVKTAEVAEMRRTAEAEIANQRAQQLAVINQALSVAQNFDQILAEGQKTDWAELAQKDPTAYVQKRAAFEARVNEIQSLQQQKTQMDQQRQYSIIAEQNRMLSEKLPEWNSEEGRTNINKTASSYLQTAGFSNDEIKQLVDHRVLMVVLEAAKFREMQAAQHSISEKKAAPIPPKTQKPAASQDAKHVDARVTSLKKQAMRTGRDDDIAAAVLASL